MNLEFTKRAIKNLGTLERSQPKYFKPILSKIQSLVNNHTVGKQLVGPLKGKWSLRVGDHRIIDEIIKNTIYILTINYRREVYK